MCGKWSVASEEERMCVGLACGFSRLQSLPYAQRGHGGGGNNVHRPVEAPAGFAAGFTAGFAAGFVALFFVALCLMFSAPGPKSPSSATRVAASEAFPC